ncbi:hypothetical protein GCM10027421_31630 [Microbacterium shaanxiense]
MSDVSTTPDLAELLARVDRLEAVQAITLVHNEYVRALATRDWDAVADLYTEDAECDIRHHGVHIGRESIRGMFSSDLREVVLSNDGYILSSPSITVEGDHASGTWTWHRFQSDFQTGLGRVRIWGPWSEGRYEAEYRREDGHWRISRLWFRVHAPDSDAEIAAAIAQNRTLGSALRPQNVPTD